MDMKTIAIWNMKGGVGKTTLTINLAYMWSQMGKRILVIDLDPQVNTTPVFTKANENGVTIADVLEDPGKAKGAVRHTRYPDIDIIKGSACLWEGYPEDSLERAIETIKESYDAVLIDCQPSCGTLTRTALYTADIVLTPAIMDRFCLENLRTASDILADMEEDRKKELKWAIFANKVKGIKSQMSIHRDLLIRHNYPFLGTAIRDSAVVPNSLALRKPVAKHMKGSPVAKDLWDLSQEVWEVAANG